jgi:hypothetical protein
MYAKGEGAPKNNIRAYLWWSMAKTQGHANAAGNFETLKPRITTKQKDPVSIGHFGI